MATEYEGMGLSPEELAALEEKDEKVPTDPPADPEPKDPPQEEDPPEDDDPPADPDPEDPPKEDPKPEPVIDGDGYEELELAEFQPYEVRHVQDFDVQIKAFDTQRADLQAKFKEGELTFEDFLVKDREIQAEADKLRDVEREAMTMEHLNEQNAQRTWFSNVKSFIAEVKRVEALDYNNKTLNAALDNAVKTLAAAPENATKPHGWFLREAHRIVKTDLGLMRKPDPAPKLAAKPADKARAPKLDDVPPTLRKLPEAAPNDPKGDDEFANLDQLEGMELEEALAKMSDAQARRYLRG